MKPGHEHAQTPQSPTVCLPRATERWVIRSTGSNSPLCSGSPGCAARTASRSSQGSWNDDAVYALDEALDRGTHANPGSRDARAQREHGSACPATDGDGSRSGVALGPPAFARRDGKSVEARDDCGGRGWVVAVAAATSLPAAHAAQGTTFADRLEASATSSSECGVTASNGASFGAPYGGGKRSRICVRLPADPARRGATRARRRAAVLARTLHTCCTAPAMKHRLFALVEGAGRPLHPRRRGAEQRVVPDRSAPRSDRWKASCSNSRPAVARGPDGRRLSVERAQCPGSCRTSLCST
jgi:hypothetical protein